MISTISSFQSILGFSPEEYCTTMHWKQLPDGTKTEHDEKYYLLSDVIAKDRQIRNEIQIQWIQDALSRHQFERVDKNFTKGCLFCRDNTIETTRFHYIDHLYTKHYLNLGRFESLVYIDELIDLIEEKMSNLICIFCEKIFKDRSVMKEHMRKKAHKSINPDNKAYDRFYLCNYRMKDNPLKDQIGAKKNVNLAKTKKHPADPGNSEELSTTVFDKSDDSDWSDWNNDQDIDIICLFCQRRDANFASVTDHMKADHNFDFHNATKSYNFYQKVKMINYIRRKVHLKQCLSCEMKSESVDELVRHMNSENHINCSEKDFEKVEFFFPTFEDDAFLCNIDNINEEAENLSDDSGAQVIAEDPIVSVNEAAEMLSKERFVDL